MKPLITVTGTIVLHDEQGLDKQSMFSVQIESDGHVSASQWGANEPRLAKSRELFEAIRLGVENQ